MIQKTGVLLINLGTPNSPTPECVRDYLAEFLTDPRIIPVWRPLWWLVLQGYILRTRPRYTAEKYQQIWTAHGSPLLVNSKNQVLALQTYLDQANKNYKVVLGMRYGIPSISDALEQLCNLNIKKLI